MRARITIPRIILGAALCLAAAVTAQTASASAVQKQLPKELSDSVFWNIISDFSENEQPFTTYLVSNEVFYPTLVNTLLTMNLRGGAYIGVAPEQNYHYIAALRPDIAFILDIRRQAIMQHMMYKAIFELSPTRADFISLLFTKPKPAAISNSATAYETWTAFWYVPTDTTKYTANLNRILDQLTKKHKFPLSSNDSALVEFTFSRFYVAGPNIQSSGNASANDAMNNTFGNLTATDRSFLSNDAGYQVIRDLNLKNLIIPVNGDFAGLKALRAIGRFLKENNVQLTAYYASNVETYLGRDGKAPAFFENLGMLPLNAKSTLIRGISPGSICNIQIVLASNRCQ